MHPVADYPNFQSAVADTHFPSAQGSNMGWALRVRGVPALGQAVLAEHSTLQATGTPALLNSQEIPHPSLGLWGSLQDPCQWKWQHFPGCRVVCPIRHKTIAIKNQYDNTMEKKKKVVRNRDFSVRKQLLIRIRNKGNTERPTYYMVVVNSITVSVRCVACLLSYK